MDVGGTDSGEYIQFDVVVGIYCFEDNISIVAYEVYYRQNLGELSEKLLEVEEESI